MFRRALHEDHPPRHAARYGIPTVLGMVASCGLLFAVIRAAGSQWPTVVVCFLMVFLSIAFFSVLGVLLDFAERFRAPQHAGLEVSEGNRPPVAKNTPTASE